MSDPVPELRVAVVVEGPTDTVIIEAALRALLPRPFVLTVLQPEPTRPKVGIGAGWGGVVRWCLDSARRGAQRLEDDPTLPGFDLFVLHVDADVADRSYTEVSDAIAQEAVRRGWPVLPAGLPCPPPSRTADAMRACLLAWANLAAPGPRTVLCVPSKATDAWLAASLLEDSHSLLRELECRSGLDTQLANLPKQGRVKKSERAYRAHEQTVTTAWRKVRDRCSQAERFSTDVLAVSG